MGLSFLHPYTTPKNQMQDLEGEPPPLQLLDANPASFRVIPRFTFESSVPSHWSTSKMLKKHKMHIFLHIFVLNLCFVLIFQGKTQFAISGALPGDQELRKGGEASSDRQGKEISLEPSQQRPNIAGSGSLDPLSLHHFR